MADPRAPTRSNQRLQRFTPEQGWTTLEPLPQPLRAASAAALDGRIYVTGGQTDAGVTRRVEVYDVRRRVWSEGPALPAPLFNHSTVALGGTLVQHLPDDVVEVGANARCRVHLLALDALEQLALAAP